jgi:hypothetical protein
MHIFHNPGYLRNSRIINVLFYGICMVRPQQSAIEMMTLLTGKWFVLKPIMYLLKHRTTGGLTVLFCDIYRSCYYILYNGRRTPSDGKSSHCIWQGEPNIHVVINYI